MKILLVFIFYLQFLWHYVYIYIYGHTCGCAKVMYNTAISSSGCLDLHISVLLVSFGGRRCRSPSPGCCSRTHDVLFVERSKRFGP